MAAVLDGSRAWFWTDNGGMRKRVTEVWACVIAIGQNSLAFLLTTTSASSPLAGFIDPSHFTMIEASERKSSIEIESSLISHFVEDRTPEHSAADKIIIFLANNESHAVAKQVETSASSAESDDGAIPVLQKSNSHASVTANQ